MHWRFNISRKIALGFGAYIAAVGFVFFLTDRTLSGSRDTIHQISEVYAPSKQELNALRRTIDRSVALIKHWVDVQSRADDRQKTELRTLMARTIPQQISRIDSLAAQWPDTLNHHYVALCANVNQLKAGYQDIMYLLPDLESYNSPVVEMQAKFKLVEGEGIPTNHLEFSGHVDYLLTHFDQQESYARTHMGTSFYDLSNLLFWLILILFGSGVFIAIVVIRSITLPVNQLKKTLLYLGKGIYPSSPIRVSNDEIGDMAFAVNRLVDGLRKTKEFSSSVGRGQFEAPYTPLSDEDELGYALIKMRDELAKNERILELKVVERTNEVVLQKEEIEKQKEKVTELYKDLKDSINYAKRIQQSILPTDEQISGMFPNSFVFYRPKDIVSGDFYWFKQAGSKKLFAAIDCTGHGVPGAFMSLVGYNMLNQVTKVFTRPSQILNNLNRVSDEVLRGQEGASELRDGMDLALCCLDENTLELDFAGAHNPLFLIRDGELREIRGDKFAIGSFKYGQKEYTNHTVQLQEGDQVYLFSDGYADQFGGPRGKKFLKKRFRQLLLSIAELPMHEQRTELHKSWVQWKGTEEQVDDILVLGMRI